MTGLADDLKEFLLESNRQGYAGGEARSWVTHPDGSTTISFALDPWRMDDNFFGGEPYGGREVVFHEDRPLWMMAYYGWVDQDEDADTIYGFLRLALRAMPADNPLRGPHDYEGGGLVYRNRWEGDVGRFVGTEQILNSGHIVYSANYAGGWVDRRRAV